MVNLARCSVCKALEPIIEEVDGFVRLKRHKADKLTCYGSWVPHRRTT